MRVKEAIKLSLAGSFQITGLNWALHRLQLAALSPFIRIVNYHDVPRAMASTFEEQLLFYRKRFVPVGRQELEYLLAGRWSSAKPGILLTFDDGLASHAQVVAPLLEKHGFSGCFFVPIDFIDAQPEDHEAYGRDHRIGWSPLAAADERHAMTWDDVRRLDHRHTIGCHTHTHVRLSDKLTPDELDHEIKESKQRLEAELGHEVDVFCWVGGEEWSYSSGAAKAIRDAGYRLSFMNTKALARQHTDPLQLHRVHVEGQHPIWFVRYILSGFFDVIYAAERSRVNRLTSGPPVRDGKPNSTPEPSRDVTNETARLP